MISRRLVIPFVLLITVLPIAAAMITTGTVGEIGPVLSGTNATLSSHALATPVMAPDPTTIQYYSCSASNPFVNTQCTVNSASTEVLCAGSISPGPGGYLASWSWTTDYTGSYPGTPISSVGHQGSDTTCIDAGTATDDDIAVGGIGLVNPPAYTLYGGGQSGGATDTYATTYVVSTTGSFVVIMVGCSEYQCPTVNVPAGCTTQFSISISGSSTWGIVCQSQVTGTYNVSAVLANGAGRAAIGAYVFAQPSAPTISTTVSTSISSTVSTSVSTTASTSISTSLSTTVSTVSTILAPSLAPTFNVCGYAGSGGPGGNYVNANDWIGINAIVVLVTIMIAGLVYALSGLTPTSMREKMRGAARYEAVQVIVSLLIIFILILFASTSCYVGETMAYAVTSNAIVLQLGGSPAPVTATFNYQGPFEYAETWLSTLLYQKGVALVTNLYSTSVEYAINANVLELGLSTVQSILTATTKPFTTSSGISIQVQPSFSVAMIYLSYSDLFVAAYATLTVLTFGSLFVLWLMLFIIYATALTIIVPIAIIVRSFGFVGPRLRQAADEFLAVAIAFYFILPLMISFDPYAISWMYANNNGAYICSAGWLNGGCNGLVSLSPGSLFTQGSISSGTLSLPTDLIGLGSGGGAWGLGNFGALLEAPTAARNFANTVAEYMFAGVVLLALDFAVTLGLAIGLARGLTSIGNLISSGPVWGG